MKKCVHFFFAFAPAILSFQRLAAADTTTNEWGATTNNVQMSIRLKGDPADNKSNPSVRLLIRYRNTSSNETFMLYRANSIEDDPRYSFVVLSPSGKDAWPSAQREISSGASVMLGPSQVVEFEFNLSRRCRLEEVGSYKIIATYAVWSREKHTTFQVVSNTLRLSLVPGG